MSRKKRVLYIVITVVILIGLGAAGKWGQVHNRSRSSTADDSVKLAEFHSTDAGAIKRGEYVMRLADCAACHRTDFSGGYKIDTPFGTLLSSNITPDKSSGIGEMTERDFFNAVRQGQGSKGLLYPAMPYTAYVKMSDADLHDLWAYISTLPAAKQLVDENSGMLFPYNIRLVMSGWNMLFFDNRDFNGDIKQSSEWNRGKYIVDGPGHCSLCHTERNLLGGEISDSYLQGGSMDLWYAPDITPNLHAGIGHWQEGYIEDYLKTGSSGMSVAAGPMAESVEHSTQYFNDADLKAVAVYLRALPASDRVAGAGYSLSEGQKRQGQLTYEVNCSACHGMQGEGISGMVPAFAGNQGMLQNPTNMIHAMLRGTRAPHTAERQTAAAMPAFDWKMSDQQVADILNYMRNSWGNQAPEVQVGQVADMRKASGAGDKLKLPAQQ